MAYTRGRETVGLPLDRLKVGPLLQFVEVERSATAIFFFFLRRSLTSSFTGTRRRYKWYQRSNGSNKFHECYAKTFSVLWADVSLKRSLNIIFVRIKVLQSRNSDNAPKASKSRIKKWKVFGNHATAYPIQKFEETTAKTNGVLDNNCSQICSDHGPLRSVKYNYRIKEPPPHQKKKKKTHNFYLSYFLMIRNYT